MDVVVYLGGGAAALLAVGALLRAVWAVNRRLVVIVDAVRELAPEGQCSMRDVVMRTEEKLDENTRQLRDLERRFEEHLAGLRF